jgi:outer membrane lipoprotein carrier protein
MYTIAERIVLQRTKHGGALSARHPRSTAWTAWVSLVCALGLLALSTAAAAGGEERLRAYLAGLETLSSEFRQITLSSDGGRMLESEGTLYLKRPGRFRWEYMNPTAQVIVADGKRVWLHDIELDQISHQGQDGALGGTPAQLLASDDPIERHFRILPWEAGDEREWVELQPKAEEGQVVRIRVGFLGEALDTLLMEDSFGQITRFSFIGTTRNPRLKDDLFRFDLPAGGDFLEVH